MCFYITIFYDYINVDNLLKEENRVFLSILMGIFGEFFFWECYLWWSIGPFGGYVLWYAFGMVLHWYIRWIKTCIHFVISLFIVSFFLFKNKTKRLYCFRDISRRWINSSKMCLFYIFFYFCNFIVRTSRKQLYSTLNKKLFIYRSLKISLVVVVRFFLNYMKFCGP